MTILHPQANATLALEKSKRPNYVHGDKEVISRITFNYWEADICNHLQLKHGSSLPILSHTFTVVYEFVLFALIFVFKLYQPAYNHMPNKFEFGSVSQDYLRKWNEDAVSITNIIDWGESSTQHTTSKSQFCFFLLFDLNYLKYFSILMSYNWFFKLSFHLPNFNFLSVFRTGNRSFQVHEQFLQTK